MENCEYKKKPDSIADILEKIKAEQYAEWSERAIGQFVSDHSGGRKCDQNATEMRPSFISDHSGGANKMVDHVAEVGNMAQLTIEQMRDMVRCMTERAEAAEARCETLEKMVKEYQEVIVPGYRERAEKAERELQIAVGGLVGQCKYCRKNQECTSRKGSHLYCWEWCGVKEE